MITSTQNRSVISWKKLRTTKYRQQTQTFIIEGFHLVEEAYQSEWEIEKVLIREDTRLPEWAESFSVETLASNVFKDISDTKTPQGIAAVVKMQEHEMSTSGFALIADGIQDPGNLGTLIRSADAFGFSQVILGEGTVDMYNEKVIRASQGSVFHLPVLKAGIQSSIQFLQRHSFTVWASTLDDAMPLREAKLSGNIALIVGNEGEGIHPSVIQEADERVMIPIIGKAESLNVAVAAGIMMHAISEGK